MNKKLMMIGISIVVGGAMLGTTAMASLSSSSGYDVYKEALKNSHTVQSVSADVDVSVSDNGNPLIVVNDSLKADLVNQDMSCSLTITGGEQTQAMDIYRQDGQTIMKNSNSDVYEVMSGGPDRAQFADKRGDAAHQELAGDVENIIDLAVGNLKDYITLDSNSDGTQEVNLQLSGSQITPLQNAVASLFVKYGSDKSNSADSGNMPFNSDLKSNMPQLVTDIQVENVGIKAIINAQNLIENQVMNLTVSGKDADGIAHNLVVSIELDLYDFNNTTADGIDLSDKQVENIEMEDFEGAECPGHCR